MNNTQRISYTVTGYNFTEMSKGRGSIEYQLMDELGNERTVTALANINMFKKVNNIRPIYKRELPLIEALSKTQLNDSVMVDFTDFNKTHTRSSLNKQKISIPAVKSRNAGTEEIYDLSSLFENKMRAAQLLFITIAGFIAVTYVLSLLP